MRRSRARINELLDAYEHSGLSQKAFCREHEVPLATFTNWLRKRKKTPDEPAGFHPVRLSDGGSGPRVCLPNGVEIVLSAQSGVSAIAALIDALKRNGSC